MEKNHPEVKSQSVAIPVWLPWLATIISLSYIVGTIIVGQLFLAGRQSPKLQTLAKWMPIPVAQVDGFLIWAREYLEYRSFIETFIARSEESGQAIDTDISVDQQVIDILVSNRIVERAAELAGISVTEQEIDAAYTDILVAQSEDAPRDVSEEELNTILGELYGTDQNELRDLIRIRLIENKVKTELLERVSFRQILVTNEETANEVMTKLGEGQDFKELAAEYSEHKESREVGGEIGFVARGEQLEPIETALFSSEIGLLPEPVKTDFGYHIIEILDKQGTVQQSFEEWLSSAREQFNARVFLHLADDN